MPLGIALTIGGTTFYTERRSGTTEHVPNLTGPSTARTWEYTLAITSQAELDTLLGKQIAGPLTVQFPTAETATCVVIIADSPLFVTQYIRVPISLVEVIS